MEFGSKYDDVITRYLLTEADPEEEKFVEEWMASDEKNRLYVESLQHTLHLVSLTKAFEKLEVEQEWEQFRQGIFKEPSRLSAADKEQPVYWESLEEERRNRRTRVYKLLIGTAIAASVVFLIGLGANWFSGDVNPDNRVAKQTKSVKEETKIDPRMAVVQHEVNTSGKTKQLILPDGSKIALFDSSELTYKEPVNGNRRDVYLTGKADFQVAKAKAKPFTVFSEDISTTALGTVFSVVAKKRDTHIWVKLLEGKVVVRSLKGYNGQWKKDIYLVPGQELIYDKARRSVTVRSFTSEKQTAVETASLPKENPSVPHYDKRSWFMFNNQPLNEIFDALADMYDAKIMYAKKDVKDMYFIGTYDKTDSLEKILRQIALLNSLKVTRQNDTFKIERQVLKK